MQKTQQRDNYLVTPNKKEYQTISPKYQSIFFHGFHDTNVIFLAYYQEIFIFVATHSNFCDLAIF